MCLCHTLIDGHCFFDVLPPLAHIINKLNILKQEEIWLVYVCLCYTTHTGCKKVRPSSKAHLMFNICFLYMRLKSLMSGRGQGLLRINHFMQLFTLTCKQTADNVVE